MQIKDLHNMSANDWNDGFEEGFRKGYNNAIDDAIEIVKENYRMEALEKLEQLKGGVKK